MVYIDPPYGIKFGSNWQVSAREARRQGRQARGRRPRGRADQGLPRHVGAGHPLVPDLPARPAPRRARPADRVRIVLRPDRRRERPPRSQPDGRGVWQRELRQPDHLHDDDRCGALDATDVSAGVVDYVLWYARDIERTEVPAALTPKQLGGAGAAVTRIGELPDGITTRMTLREQARDVDSAGRGAHIPADNLTSPGPPRQTTVFPVELRRTERSARAQGDWKTNCRRAWSGCAAQADSMPRRQDSWTMCGTSMTSRHPIYTNVWDDTGRSGFARRQDLRRSDGHQGHRALHADVHRPGDLVLDPTCGSGTTAYVAEQWGRRWITIDTSRVALALARQRLMGAKFPVLPARRLRRGSRQGAGADRAGRCRGSEFDGDIRQGFVYERVQHITLKSIANNPDIKEGMSSRARSTQRSSGTPTSSCSTTSRTRTSKKVRVAGPFTVESLSPHRSLAFAGGPTAHRVAQRDRGRQGRGRAELRAVDPRQPRARPASRTAAGRSGSTSRRSRPTPASTSRRSASEPARRRATRRRASASRSARSTARSARRSSRRPRARRSTPRTSTCSACSASPSTRRSPA